MKHQTIHFREDHMATALVFMVTEKLKVVHGTEFRPVYPVDVKCKGKEEFLKHLSNWQTQDFKALFDGILKPEDIERIESATLENIEVSGKKDGIHFVVLPFGKRVKGAIHLPVSQ